MITDQNIQLVRTCMDEFMRGNAEPLLSAITHDAVIKAVIPDCTPLSGDFRGREGFLRYFGAAAEVMEVLEFRTIDYTASADHVVILGFERARIRRTGRMLECDVATVITLAAGKIT